MKRCPECMRDYYDESLRYCLDDGTALLDGPASGDGVADEPRTAILSDAFGVPPSGGQPQDQDTSRIIAAAATEPIQERTFYAAGKNSLVFGIIAVAIITAIGVGIYWIYGRGEAKQIRSIAVLPFQNNSSDADTEYLSDGLAESLIYRLSQIPDLKVSPRSSAFRYKGENGDVEKIGCELGVDAVMSGRLVQRGDNLTISVDLVDVRNKKTLWGEQFERKMADLLATQREIASAITEKLQLKLSGTDSKGIAKQYTNSNEAYQLYLKGRYYWNKRTAENVRKSIELLKAATEKDPNFALAYAGLADSYVVASTYTGERASETMPQAKQYAQKAIELDPTLAEPHAALGLVTWFLDWDQAGAEKEFRRALELNPNYPTAHHWYSRHLRGLGRIEEGFKEIKRAEELDPMSLIFINNVAESYIDKGDLTAAYRECQRIVELDPNFWAVYQTLVWVLVKQGNYDEALAAADKSVQLSNRSNASLGQLGHVYGRLGRRDEAMAVVRELEQKFAGKLADGKDLAVVYAGLNDRDRAFEWLDKAFEYRSFLLTALNIEPLLEPLHGDPRWPELKRRVGIPQ